MAQGITFDITPEKQASQLQFLRRQLFGGPPGLSRHDVDLAGKTAIVTGANGGLGLECSRHLLNLGVSKLIIAVRNEAKGEAAREALTTALEPGQSIEVWQLDYASYESIQEFAQRAEDIKPQLDIVLLNAAFNRTDFSLNRKTGHEEVLQINYLSNVLLILLFLHIFKKTKSNSPQYSPGRITVVSSDMAGWAKFNERTGDPLLQAFDSEASYDKFNRYASTKLLTQLFVTEIAKRVSSSLAVVNCANPGLCWGGMMGGETSAIFNAFIRVICRSLSTGARALVDAAVRQGETSHGQYVEDGMLRPMAPFVYSEEAGQLTRRLWDETMEELSFAGAREIVGNLAECKNT
ncbi:NAD(P)-binding protein [Annulohypoxylon maeteangense]|uniref:NAD(P)-binding protein n=1 Tax=Annulohypoxylon maeteangense TaxID=1927788 RepID=UPI002007FFA6|nr:NAD(P)-binding protein [Annulohypoxylon maeteangense]KAI0886787.1 NAD(P)-binding protein [Annulohypoxylon maeteangense]